jgi:N4-gp56 family major capsid protein
MILTSTLQNQFQRFFSKDFLEHAEFTLRLHEFAMKKPLPKEAGARYISFFRPEIANAANVQNLAEGMPISVFRDQVYTRVDFELEQYGQASKFSDILSATQLLDNMKTMSMTMGEEAALKLDTLMRDALINPTTGLQQRFSGGAANYAALQALSASAGALTALDLIDSCTQLRNQLAPTDKGFYWAILPPVGLRDIMNDNRWLLAHQYGNDYGDLKKAEVGQFGGIRSVWGNNPFTESTTTPIGQLVSGGNIWTTIIVGRDAFGVPSLAGDSPMKPSIIIVDEPDSANPLAQFITVGWKLFYAVGVLNPFFGVAVRHQSPFVGVTTPPTN